MEKIFRSVRLLDEHGKLIDGFIIGEPNADDQDDDFDEANFRESEDLPPLTDAEAEDLQDKLYEVFSKALEIDASQPVTPQYEQSAAHAFVEYASMAMEHPKAAAGMKRVRFVQINPHVPVAIDRVMNVLEATADATTVRLVRNLMSGSAAPSEPTTAAPLRLS